MKKVSVFVARVRIFSPIMPVLVNGFDFLLWGVNCIDDTITSKVRASNSNMLQCGWAHLVSQSSNNLTSHREKSFWWNGGGTMGENPSSDCTEVMHGHAARRKGLLTTVKATFCVIQVWTHKSLTRPDLSTFFPFGKALPKDSLIGFTLWRKDDSKEWAKKFEKKP